MLIGLSGGGKSSIIKTLATALSKISPSKKVSIHKLNPKAISMAELYGYFNESTNTWVDGVFAKIFKQCEQDTSD